LRHADLHRVVAEDIGCQIIEAGLFPGAHVHACRRLQPAFERYNGFFGSRLSMPAFCETPMTISSTQALSVLTVPAFKDNYLWLIHDGVHAAVVDPGDAKPILARSKRTDSPSPPFYSPITMLTTLAAFLNCYSIIRCPFSARATTASPP
jgi:hypothetical protein